MKQKVKKAVFPAAGLGTRFLPATKAQPKEMLPLVDKPIIQYGVEEAMASGCDQIIIVTGRGKTAIEDHFDVSYELEKQLEEKNKLELLAMVRRISDMIHVSYTRQKEALGLGHAVLVAKDLVGNEPFAVLLADDVVDAETPCLKQLIDVFEETQCSVIATQVVEGKAISAYGVLDATPVPGYDGRLFEIRNLVEKPPARNGAVEPGHHRPLYPDAAHLRVPGEDHAGSYRRVAAHRRTARPASARKNVWLSVRGQAPRHRRQTRLPESHGGVRSQTRRPRRGISRVVAAAEVLTSPRLLPEDGRKRSDSALLLDHDLALVVEGFVLFPKLHAELPESRFRSPAVDRQVAVGTFFVAQQFGADEPLGSLE